MINRVYRLRSVTMSINVFPYGNGFRVKYTKTSNNKNDSKLLAYSDEEYSTEQAARKAFEEINFTCETTFKRHWNK